MTITQQNNLQKSYETAFDSVSSMVDQCCQAWEESRKIDFPTEYKNAENIIICGMGGSSNPSHIIKSIFELKKPLCIVEDYNLPSWANDKTLVLVSSYSGNTEEPINCAQIAKNKGCLISGITSGGNLEKFLTEGNYPFYHFDTKYNPSKMPRYGTGYTLFGEIGILCNLGYLYDQDLKSLGNEFVDSIKYLSTEVVRIQKTAKSMVNIFTGQVLCVISAEHLQGNAHYFANQMNESPKTLSFSVALPEFDHNFILGFSNRVENVEVIFLQSENYSQRLQLRSKVTKDIINKNGYNVKTYLVPKTNKLTEMLDVLLFSSYFSVELARKNNIDPLIIPEIDQIKHELSLTPNK